MRRLIIFLLILSFILMWVVFFRFTDRGIDIGYLLTTVIFSLLPIIFLLLIYRWDAIVERFPALIFFAGREELDDSLWRDITRSFSYVLGITGILISAYLVVVQYTAFDFIRRRDVANPEFFITFAVITPIIIFGLFLFMMYRLASKVEDNR